MGSAIPGRPGTQQWWNEDRILSRIREQGNSLAEEFPWNSAEFRSPGTTFRYYTQSMAIYFSLLVALIGLLMFVLCANGNLREIGRISYGCGLLAFLLRSADGLFRIVPP